MQAGEDDVSFTSTREGERERKIKEREEKKGVLAVGLCRRRVGAIAVENHHRASQVRLSSLVCYLGRERERAREREGGGIGLSRPIRPLRPPSPSPEAEGTRGRADPPSPVRQP